MLSLTFCDRQTLLFGTLLYDTFCVEICVTFGRGGGEVKRCHNDVIFSKIGWRCPLIPLDTILPEIYAFVIGFSCTVWTK